MSFSGDIKQFAVNLEHGLERDRKAFVIDLFSSVIADTPVDSGRARGNWQVTTGSPASGETNRVDKQPEKAPPGPEMAQHIESNIGNLTDIVYMTNNLPYIERLEFEQWSSQAPAGMVRKNVARIQQLITKHFGK